MVFLVGRVVDIFRGGCDVQVAQPGDRLVGLVVPVEKRFQTPEPFEFIGEHRMVQASPLRDVGVDDLQGSKTGSHQAGFVGGFPVIQAESDFVRFLA
ncbi:MAG: hypothetical protein A2269_01635 [Lentisphaerae bacterium RIFOXYA12_FULL_60_10]|nr:MAG: hypothetical protein A2269_01635 [Lentisphaerae bacterium RIFOXYA12_FULL_60_10]